MPAGRQVVLHQYPFSLAYQVQVPKINSGGLAISVLVGMAGYVRISLLFQHMMIRRRPAYSCPTTTSTSDNVHMYVCVANDTMSSLADCMEIPQPEAGRADFSVEWRLGS